MTATVPPAEPTRPRSHATTGRGIVEAIHIAPAAGAEMEPVERVRAIEGVGLAGDRYAINAGHHTNTRVDRHVTLIEAEEVERLALRAGIVLGGGETRRNVTTRGIRLNELLGRRFRIGAVECEGTRLCEPCQYLADLLRKPVLEPLVHRAGLRARILSGGEISLGDEVVALD